MRQHLITTDQGPAVLLTQEVISQLHLEDDVDVELTESSLVIRRALSLDEAAKRSDEKFSEAYRELAK